MAVSEWWKGCGGPYWWYWQQQYSVKQHEEGVGAAAVVRGQEGVAEASMAPGCLFSYNIATLPVQTTTTTKMWALFIWIWAVSGVSVLLSVLLQPHSNYHYSRFFFRFIVLTTLSYLDIYKVFCEDHSLKLNRWHK